MSCPIRPLDASTWDAFAELVERNNGIFAGAGALVTTRSAARRGLASRGQGGPGPDRSRSRRARPRRGRRPQGWCQYGSPQELPSIKHKREYDKNAPPRPDCGSPAST